MPVKPSILDVEASRPTVEQLRRIGRPYAFVLNQCAPSSQSRTIVLCHRACEGRCAGAVNGGGARRLSRRHDNRAGRYRIAPKGKAAQEITLLWQWVKSRLRA